MAGVFGSGGFGQGTPWMPNQPAQGGGGILGGAQQGGGWGSTLGIIGASLADAGANFGGHPADAVNLAPMLQRQQQMQTMQALSQAVNSSDPNVRQQAYSIMPMLGMDPSAFQKNQASQALPKLLGNMQPLTGPTVTPQQWDPTGTAPAPVNNTQTYTPSLTQALQDTGSPELSSQMAPQIIAQAEKANEPFTLTPGAARFQNGTQVASVPEKAPPPPEIVRTAQFLFPNDMKAQSDYIQKNSRASTVNINSGNQDAGWQMAVDPANNNTPFRINVRSGEAVGLDGKPYTPQGYGKPATNNMRTAIAIYMDKWKAEHPNASSADTMTAMNMFTGQQAENRTLGTQGAKVESANAGLDTVIGQAKGAYAKLPRGQFVPFNKLAEMAQTGVFSSPEQADAYAADTGVINLWGKAINPTGVLTVEAQRRGEQMLSQAQSPEAHNAVYDRMLAEGNASVGGVNRFRPPGGNVPAKSGAPPAAASTLPKLPTKSRFKIEQVDH